jgi:hypothetical protein
VSLNNFATTCEIKQCNLASFKELACHKAVTRVPSSFNSHLLALIL